MRSRASDEPAPGRPPAHQRRDFPGEGGGPWPRRRAIGERRQLERLGATLGWSVELVAFHRERLGAATIGALSDLARLPFVRKTDLREQYPFGLLAVPRREVARIHASSGTKGKPTVAAYSAGDLDVWREVMARALTAAGARRRDP